MSGAADSYALFAFPPDLAVKHYIQSLPEMTVFVNNMKYDSHSCNYPTNAYPQ
jgi:hypothetical protein